MPATDCLPPHDLDAERAFLGSLLIDPEIIATVCDAVVPSAFFDAQHRMIFEALLELWNRRVPADVVTVRNELDTTERGRRVESFTLADLIQSAPSPVYAIHYGEIVMQLAERRAWIDGASDLVRLAHDTSFDLDIDEALTGIRDRAQPFRPASSVATVRMDSFVEQHAERVVDRWLGVTDDPVVRTGLPRLDYVLTGGMRRKQLIVIGGRPGMAKSSLAVHMALEARTLFFSLEMSKEDIVNRMVAVVGDIDYRVVNRDRNPTLEEQERWLQGASGVAQLPVWINDTSALTTMKMQSEVERRIVDDGIELVVIDHLDHIGDRVRSDSVEQKTATLIRRCQLMAKNCNIPVVVLSQLNRNVENRPGCFPLLSDLRNSGTVEQDADVVMLLYRRRYYSERNYPSVQPDQSLDYVGHSENQRIQIVVAKNRNGEVATCSAAWTPKTMAFEEES